MTDRVAAGRLVFAMDRAVGSTIPQPALGSGDERARRPRSSRLDKHPRPQESWWCRYRNVRRSRKPAMAAITGDVRPGGRFRRGRQAGLDAIQPQIPERMARPPMKCCAPRPRGRPAPSPGIATGRWPAGRGDVGEGQLLFERNPRTIVTTAAMPRRSRRASARGVQNGSRPAGFDRLNVSPGTRAK